MATTLRTSYNCRGQSSLLLILWHLKRFGIKILIQVFFVSWGVYTSTLVWLTLYIHWYLKVECCTMGRHANIYEVEFEIREWRRGVGNIFESGGSWRKDLSSAYSGEAVRTVCVRVPAQVSTPVTFWFVKLEGSLVLYLLSNCLKSACPDADQARLSRVGETLPHAKLVLTSPECAA